MLGFFAQKMLTMAGQYQKKRQQVHHKKMPGRNK